MLSLLYLCIKISYIYSMESFVYLAAAVIRRNSNLAVSNSASIGEQMKVYFIPRRGIYILSNSPSDVRLLGYSSTLSQFRFPKISHLSQIYFEDSVHHFIEGWQCLDNHWPQVYVLIYTYVCKSYMLISP